MSHFQTYHIPGAVVAVVKDGQILFAKGYGYADLEAGRPVDPSETLFRIGSVSKLFTWTAVMQLVEKGMMDLNRDVNDYLIGAPFEVPATYSEPITVTYLMNHTAGFEDRGVGLFSHDPKSIRPLGEILADDLPQRVRPPGEVTAYSNHGTALAGYIVELLSGVPWTTYIEDNILEPLHMDYTTPRQPLLPDLESQLATGYEYEAASGRFQPQPFEYIPAAPAGAISATALDMAKFMIAHLQLGRFEDSQILREETAQQMQATSFTQDQRLGGIAHGFLEQPYGRLRTIGHGGDTFLFHSEMRLLPSHNVGVFVAYNSPDGAIARDQLMRAFLDRYFSSYANWPHNLAEKATDEIVRPGAEKDLGLSTGRGSLTDTEPESNLDERADSIQSRSVENLRKYAGVYSPTRVPHTTVDRLIELMSITTVRCDPADRTGSTLLVTLFPGRGVQRFRQVGPGVFQEVDGPGRIAFVTGIKSQPDRLLMGSAWMSEKMNWHETPSFQVGVAVACLFVFFSAVICWPVTSVHKWRRRPLYSHSCSADFKRMQSLARWLAGVMSAIFLMVSFSLLVTLKNPFTIAFGVPLPLQVILALALVAALLSLVVVMMSVVVWRNHYFTLVATASVIFALWLNHWNLLGFRF